MNDLRHEIDRIERRTRRYWVEDGVAEIAGGCGFLLVAASLVLESLFQDRLGRLLNSAFPVVVMIAVFGARWAIRAVKDRYVYPRTGYVSFDRRHANRWANMLLGAAIAAGFAFLASRSQALRDSVAALAGLILAGGFLVLGWKTRMLRFSLAGFSCAVVGVLLSMRHVNDDLAAGLLFGWCGLVLVIGGTIAFAAYLRAAPSNGSGRSDSGSGEEA